GIPAEAHATVFLALDKLGKIPESEIAALMQDGGLTPEHTAQALDLLRIQSLDDAAAILGDSPALGELRQLFEGAAIYGFEHLLQFDIAIIRGLSYYTGIVFEAFDRNRILRAIFGGGRYDNLLTAIGGAPTPAVGMGFGDVVIVELLKELQGEAPLSTTPGVAIAYMTDAERPAAMRLAKRFREEGRRVGLMLAPMKPKQFFTRVGDGTWSHAVYLGPDDVQANQAQLKDLATRASEPVSLA
ncbi:MAG: ATP phosphoribosyltransferase regulatory subunit, partial [Kiritimatiellia bacterium]